MDQSKLWNKGLRILSVLLGLALIACSIYPSITSYMETEAMQGKYLEEETNLRTSILENEEMTTIVMKTIELVLHNYELGVLPISEITIRPMLDLLENFKLQDSSAIYAIDAIEVKFKKMKNRLNKCKERMDRLAYSARGAFLEYPTTSKALNEVVKGIKKVQSTFRNLQKLASDKMKLRWYFLHSAMNKCTTNILASVSIALLVEVLISFELLLIPSESSKWRTGFITCVILAIQIYQSLQKSSLMKKLNEFPYDDASKINDLLGIPILVWVAVIMMWMNQIEYEMLVDFWKRCTIQTLTKRERFFQERKKLVKQCTKVNSEEKIEETKVPSKALSKEVKEFECPVCMEVMEAPLQIYGCSNDHLICSKCVRCVNACPICRSSFRSQKPKRRFQCESLLTLILQKESLKIQDNEFFTKLEEMYECPVCFGTMGAQSHIVGCKNDHWFCSDCMDSSHFESCPICRKSFKKQKPKRRYKAESLFCAILKK